MHLLEEIGMLALAEALIVTNPYYDTFTAWEA